MKFGVLRSFVVVLPAVVHLPLIKGPQGVATEQCGIDAVCFEDIFRGVTDKITLESVMDRMAHLEQSAADLYAFYADLFSADAEMQSLFLLMMREEKNHKSQVLLQKRLMVDSLKDEVDNRINLEVIDTTIKAIRKYIEQKRPTPAEALDFAILLESKGIESAYRSVLASQNSELGPLAKALTAGDDAHVKKLKKMKAHYLEQE